MVVGGVGSDGADNTAAVRHLVPVWYFLAYDGDEEQATTQSNHMLRRSVATLVTSGCSVIQPLLVG